MFGVMPLVPAYGRDYESLEALRKDWDAGKDFRTSGGPYCSTRDFAAGTLIEVRYSKLRKTGEFVQS